jgi:hypothetical protein
VDFSRLFTLRQARILYPEHIREYTLDEANRLVTSQSVEIKQITGIYFGFLWFDVLDIMSEWLRISTSIRLLIYSTMYRAYRMLWVPLEKVFWQHAYYIVAVLARE